MQKRKRNSVNGRGGSDEPSSSTASGRNGYPYRSAVPDLPGTSNTNQGSSRRQFTTSPRKNPSAKEIEVVDLDGEDEEEEPVRRKMENGSPPKKKKMMEGSSTFNNKGYHQNGRTLQKPTASVQFATSSSSFKVPTAPASNVKRKIVVHQQQHPGPSSSRPQTSQSSQMSGPCPPKTKDNKLQSSNEKAIKLTDSTRQVRSVIKEVILDELAKTGNVEFNWESIESLLKNIRDIINNYPNAFALKLCPLFPVSIDLSNEKELIDFAHWWLFGLSAILFAIPPESGMKMKDVDVVDTIRSMCQLLVNGHPTLVDSLTPQLIRILRDISVGSEANSVIRLHLPPFPVEGRTTTQDDCIYEIKVGRNVGDCIPHFLSAISPLLSTIFSYNIQLVVVFLEILTRLRGRMSHSSFSEVMTSFQISFIPSLGLLGETFITDSFFDILKPVIADEPKLDNMEVQKLSHSCNVRVVGSLLGVDTLLQSKISNLLFTKQEHLHYNSVSNISLQECLQPFFRDLLCHKATISCGPVGVDRLISRIHYSTKMVFHPLIGQIIARDIISGDDKSLVERENTDTSKTASKLKSATRFSPLWSKIICSWGNAEKLHNETLENRPESAHQDTYRFLMSTLSLIKLARSIYINLVQQRKVYELFNQEQLKMWHKTTMEALNNIHKFSPKERHELYFAILDTMEDLDYCDWFKVALPINLFNDLVCVAGWIWVAQFVNWLPRKPSLHVTSNSSTTSFIENSKILISKSIRTLHLDAFRPWNKCIIDIYDQFLNSEQTFENPLLVVELLRAVSEVSWPMKEIPLPSILSFFSELVISRNLWKTDASVRSALGEAIAALPCVFSYNQKSSPSSKSSLFPSRNGCGNCVVMKQCSQPPQARCSSDLNTQQCKNILIIAGPALFSSFLTLKLSVIDVIARCNNHMSLPSAFMALPMVGIAINGKSNLSQEIFKRIGMLLVEQNSENLESGCQYRFEIAQKVFRHAFRAQCREKLVAAKQTTLTLITRMKILLGIQEICNVGPLSLPVILEIFNSMLAILSHTKRDQSEASVFLLSQKIVAKFAEAHGCQPKELMTRIRTEVCQKVIRLAIKRFYPATATPADTVYSTMIDLCVDFIESVRSVINFNKKESFIEYFYPTLMEHLVPTVVSDQSRRFLLDVLSKYASVSIKAMLQDTMSLWYPVLLLDHSSQVVDCTEKFLKTTYNFEAIPAAKPQDQKILFEALIRLEGRKDKVLRILPYLCNYNTETFKQVNKPNQLTRTQTQDLLQNRVLAFFLQLDTKITSRMETAKTKIDILKSFVALMEYIGKTKITQIRPKIYQMLNSVMEQGQEFYDVLLSAWQTFTKHIDSEAFGLMICNIVAALLPLRKKASLQGKVDNFIAQLVCVRKDLTEDHYPRLYFLAGQCGNKEVKRTIDKAVTNLKTSNWMRYFDMLIEEASRNNSHIRFQAFQELLSIFKKDSAEVEKEIIGKGQVVVSKVISTLLNGLRNATGSNSEDEQMRLVITKCLGRLGALDPARFIVEEEMHGYKTRTAIATMASGKMTVFCSLYLQELIEEFQDAKDSTVFDFCVYLIRDLIADLNVKQIDEDPIWKNLSQEYRDTISPMLNVKYDKPISKEVGNISTPIYQSSHGKTYEDWVVNWMSEMIRYLPKDDSIIGRLFFKQRCLLRQNVRIATFIIPFVALQAIFHGNADQVNQIYSEIKFILDRWIVLEKRKAESTVVIRDSEVETDTDITEEVSKSSIENETLLQFRCTQVIFTVLDLLLRSLKMAERRLAVGVGRPSPDNISREQVTKLESFLQQIPPALISQVAFDNQSSVTALFYLEMELSQNPSKEYLQSCLGYLQRICVSLNDTDSIVYGVPEVRKSAPLLQELVLEDITKGNMEESVKHTEIMVHENPNDLAANYGLVHAYLSLEEPKQARDKITAILKARPEWEIAFQEVQMESLMKLRSWSELKVEVDKVEKLMINPNMQEKCLSWKTAIARIVSNLKTNKLSTVFEIVEAVRTNLIPILLAASAEVNPYKRAYDNIVQLHILAELEDIINILHTNNQNDPSNVRENSIKLYKDVKQMKTKWDSRLACTSQSRKILDEILGTRMSILEILKTLFPDNKRLCNLVNSSIMECWLNIAKDSSKCGNFTRADIALIEANKFKSPIVFIQEAKILNRKGRKETAINVLRKGIDQYFKLRNNLNSFENDPEMQKLCAKALLLQTQLLEERKELDLLEYISRYEEVINVHKDSEKGHFNLGSYFDRVLALRDNRDPNVEQEYLVRAVRSYSQSLNYGCKYVYESLPRLLFIWFNFAADYIDEKKKWDAMGPGQKAVANEKENISIDRQLYNRKISLSNMNSSIRKLVENVPAYVLMTAFPQLISRLCHDHDETWNLLKEIIVFIITTHHHQALWMTVAVSKSINVVRRERCAKIYQNVIEKKPELKQVMGEYSNLSDRLIKLAEKQVPLTTTVAKLSEIYPSLAEYINSKLSSVMLPFQAFMFYSLPPKGFSYSSVHDPFPERLLMISGIDDRVDIMTSLIRPRKITLVASNGKKYSMLCKPKDDLRKDSKLMEVNNVVNSYLKQNSESNQRQLHVRTFAVVPLNEHCGLIEWIPNLQTLRHTILALLKERGFPQPKNKKIHIHDLETFEEKRRVLSEYLMISPPVLKHWFFNNFTDHLSWYTARMSFTRTCAVMSIVGYIMGLGDRHGENILLDSNTGEVVHVDFNCLFNQGEKFTVKEMVPFRLTRNMVDAMGPLGYEGGFRRTCEIVMKMFRDNQGVFLSVLRAFVHDPLVEWVKSPKVAASESVIRTNETAKETVKRIRNRLNGTARHLSKDINTELSVRAQVKHLIDEATSDDNLCQMFSGWAAQY